MIVPQNDREPSPTCGSARVLANQDIIPVGSTELFGRSVLNRPIEVTFFGPDHGALRLLVIAGQHGDEPWGRAAVRRWMTDAIELAPSRNSREPLGRAAVFDANPDGSAAASRRNALGVDLNRDHMALTTPEVRAIHGLVRRYRPHLIVDVHNYPARRRHLLASDWILDADVQLAAPTNPAIRTSLGPTQVDDLVGRVRSDLTALGYSFAPYTLFRRSGRARPSTQNVLDARNGLALRYGIPTLLLEGRDPGRRGTEEETERTVAAQYEALRSIGSWAWQHADLLLRGPPVPQSGEVVPLDACWVESLAPQVVTLRRASSGRPEAVPWARFAGTLRVARSVGLPRAYAVRSDAREVRELLERQGLSGECVQEPMTALVEPVGGGREGEHHPSSAEGRARSLRAVDLEGYVVYSVYQRGGRALALCLEAGSRFGLARQGVDLRTPGADGASPILRIRLWDYPPKPSYGRVLLGPGTPEPRGDGSRWVFEPSQLGGLVDQFGRVGRIER